MLENIAEISHILKENPDNRYIELNSYRSLTFNGVRLSKPSVLLKNHKLKFSVEFIELNDNNVKSKHIILVDYLAYTVIDLTLKKLNNELNLLEKDLDSLFIDNIQSYIQYKEGEIVIDVDYRILRD